MNEKYMFGSRDVVGFVFALVLPFSANAGFDQCPGFFVNGVVPKVSHASPERQRELCFDAFAVLYSGQSKTPVYVVERLSKTQLADAEGEARTNKFYEEARLPSADRSRLEDFKARLQQGGFEVRFDRGHMAPAADMPTAQAMAQSFSLSNMVPQAPANNRGPWAKSIEKATRKYVLRAAGEVFVFTGPVFATPVHVLGPNRVWIPKYLYKLVYDPSANRAWAHWLENTDEARAGRPISYEELVRRTGIEFLNGVRPKGN
jgi:endonuclease G